MTRVEADAVRHIEKLCLFAERAPARIAHTSRPQNVTVCNSIQAYVGANFARPKKRKLRR
jgi:hypothetical protein